MTGIIKTLVADRKFGFISREGEAKDLVFHGEDLGGVSFKDWKVGDTTTFEITQGEKGPAATNVTRAKARVEPRPDLSRGGFSICFPQLT